MNPVTQHVFWKASDDPRTPLHATVNGALWQLRWNESPEPASLFLLFIDGEFTAEVHNWPIDWLRPPSNLWPSLRAWRATLPSQQAEIFAVDTGPSAVTVAGMDDEIGADPHDFLLIDAGGAVIDTLTFTAWSIDDELGASFYFVSDRALWHRTASVFTGPAGGRRRADQTVVENLQPVAPDEHHTLRFLFQVLARHRGKPRALPAVTNGDERTGEFGRVIAAVRTRRAAYDSATDDALLAVSEPLGNLVQQLRELLPLHAPALSLLQAAVEDFLLACRPPLHFVEAPPRAPQPANAFATLPAAVQAELRETARRLDDLSRELNQAGERYEWTDARNSAIEMYHASTYAARARDLLSDGPPRSAQTA